MSLKCLIINLNYLIQAFLFVDIDYFTRIDCLVNNVVNTQSPRHNLRANIKVHKVPLTLELYKVHKNIVLMRILWRSHIVASLFFLRKETEISSTLMGFI